MSERPASSIPRPLHLMETCHDPYANIATERVLMDAVKPGECILYLWRNSPSVIIGRNQNAWRECNLEWIERDGIVLARRLSGGGAVYHDLNNLNFTFIAHAAHYDLQRQLDVIANAVASFGVQVERSGRNDLAAGGAKFSGNAFYRTDDVRYHHGTLMVDVDTDRLVLYLNPDKRKLEAKGVESVRSRVTNLHAVSPAITTETLARALVSAFGDVYGSVSMSLDAKRIDEEQREGYREALCSWDWVYGRTPPFTHVFEERFEWGGLDVRLVVEHGYVEQASIFSDALDADFIQQMAAALEGVRYAAADLQTACDEVARALSDDPDESDLRYQMLADLRSIIG